MDRVPNSVATRLNAAVAGDHPDPNLLAALAEQALPERERAQVLLHLSRCAECRDVFALAIPPARAASPSLDTARRSWFQWPILRWAAAGACIVIVGSAVLMKRDTMMSRQDMRRAEPTVALKTPADLESDQASAEQAAPAQGTPAPSAASAAEAKSAEKKLEGTRSLAAASAEASKQKRDLAQDMAWGSPKSEAAGAEIAGQISGLKTGRVFASAPNRVPGPAAPSTNVLVYESNVQNGADKNRTDRKDSPIVGGTLPGLTVAHSEVAPGAPPPQKETVEVTAASPTMQTEAVEAREKREIVGKAKTSSNRLLLDQVQAKDQAQTNELNEVISDAGSANKAMLAKKAVRANSTYSPVSRWTISSDGQLQHSIDAGKTWQPVAVAEKVTFRALSANGPDIWVGGAAGQLYHSPDSGSQWTQVKPEFAGASLSGDIAAIEFTDIRQGKVTTATGEIWTTDDGGKTWRKQS